MGAYPADCVVIEDSPFGVGAPWHAGMTALGFTGGGHYPGHGEKLVGQGAAATRAGPGSLPG